MQNFKAKYIFQGLLFASLFLIFSTYVGKAIPWNNTFLETFYGIVIIIAFSGIVIHTLWDLDVRSQAEYEELLSKRFLPFRIPGKLIFFIILVILVHRLWLGGSDMKHIYNANIAYNATYAQNSQKIASLYDYYYHTKQEKNEIIGLNRADFFAITQIVFTNRADGKNLAWKWLQENQPVPYEQFTKFYADLSGFIESKRAEIYSIEQQKQSIVATQHVLLGSFPNNWYNKLLDIPLMEYSPTPIE